MHLWTVTGGWWSLIAVAILTFLLNPLHYVVTGFIIWDLARNVRTERMWFGIRVTRIGKTLLVRYGRACLFGLAGSIGLLLVGATVTWQSMLFVALLSIALGLIRSRLATTPIAISVAIILAAISDYLRIPTDGRFATILHFLQTFPIQSWLVIGVVATLSELGLQWWNGRDAILPALVTSKRGRRIGALKVQLGFVVPLAVWMAPIHHVTMSFGMGTRPWLFTPQTAVSIGILPAVFGVHVLLTALKPKRVLLQLRWCTLVQSMAFAVGFAVNDWLWPPYGWVAAPIVIALFELVRRVWRRIDESSDPMYSPNLKGVMVLYTIRNSLSEKLGLRPGEIITHVNQTPVHTEYDLHFAVEQNPAYAKFQVIDTRGELRLVGNPVYEGERHQLGLIVVVPNDEPALCLKRPFGFLETIYLRRLRSHRQDGE